MRESCAILDMPEPELYISSNPFPNAFAGGVERPYIVVRSAMIENLNDEELYHLIGHELGHIKAGHVLYFSVASILFPLLEMVGRRTLGMGDAVSIGLVMAFYEWSRQAEISADRAGMLVSQSMNLSLDANMKLCAGPSRFMGELNRDAYLDQARMYQDMPSWDAIGKLIWFYLMNWQSSHPLFVHRAQEMERWASSGAFERIMNGDYPKVVINA
jgi:Zn-dependent protease with chaperone function